MADTLGTLVVRIAADIRELEAGLRNATGLIRTSESATNSLSTATDTLSRVYRDLAVAATAWKAYEYVKETALLAARYETLGVSMKVVGQNAGYNAAQMEGAAQGMQKMGISMVESRQQAMRLVQAHIDLADSEKLARIAQDAAVIGNMNSSEAFAAMIHGIQSGQTDVLRTIGLNVSMEQSYKIMAGTLGKNVDALTQNEKTQAVLNAVMLEGAGIAGTYEAAMDTAGKQINSMVRYTEDLKVLQGSVFNEILTVAVMAYTDHLKESNAEMKAMAANGELKAWGMELASIFVTLANSVDNTMTAIKMAGTWVAHQGASQTISDKFDSKWAETAMSGNYSSATKDKIMSDKAAAIKAEQEVYEQAQVDIAGSIDRFERAWDKRTQANAEKAAAELHATAQQSASYNLAMLTLQKNREAGLLKETEFVKAVKTLWQANYGDNHHYTDTSANVTKAAAASEYDKLSDAIARELSLADEELKYGGKLTAADKYRVQTLDKLEEAYANGKITMQEWSKLYDAIDKTANRKLEIEMLEKVSKATEQANKTRQSEINTVVASTDKLKDHIRAQQDHNAGIGKTDEAIAALTAQRELDKASTLEGIAIKELDRNLDYQKYDAVMAEVAAMRTLAAEKARGGVLETADKSAKAWTAANKKAAEESEKFWEDALMRAFESGKGFFQSLWDTIKNTLKTTVLKVLVQGVMGSVGIGAAGMAMAGPGGSSALGSLGSASGIYNAGSALTGAYNVATGSAALGTMYANATATGLDGLLATNAAFGTATEAATGMAGAMGGVSTALAAIPVWGWAAMGVMALIGSGAFGGGGGPKTESGAGIGLGASQAKLGGGMTDYVKGLETGYTNAAQQLGITGAMKAGAFTSIDYAGDSKTQLQVLANVDGKNVYDRSKLMGGMENVGRSPDELKAALGLEASRAVFAALQASTLPKYLAGVFDGLSAGAMTQDQIASALTTAQSFKTLHDQLQALPFQNLSDLSYKAAAGLVAAAGGMDKLGANLATYYTAFYSAEEQRAQTIKNINATVAAAGISGFDAASASRSAYRALVDGQDMSTASGQKAYAALINVAAAFDQLTPAIDIMVIADKWIADTAKLTADNAKAAADAAAALAASNKALQDQLDILTGKQTANSIALRDATDVSTAVLLAQVDAQTRLNEATAQAAADARALKDALTSAGGGLSSFIQTLRGATQASSLTQTRAAYNADLTLAQAGNVDASNRLPGSGKAYLDAQTALAASAVDVQRISALMANQLSALPATQSYEQKMLDAVNATTQSVANLNGKLVTELTVSARSEIVKAISVIGQTDMSGELKRLALLDTETIAHTIDLIAGMDVSTEFKKLALDKAADFARVINITAGSDITDAQKMLALGTATSDFNRTINALGGSLTEEQKMLLNGQTDYNKVIKISTEIGGVTASTTAAPVAGTTGYTQAQKDAAASEYVSKMYADAAALGTNYLTLESRSSEWPTLLGQTEANALNALHAIYSSYTSFAVGTNSVPYDMTANIHKEERIIPAADNRELMARLRSPQGNNEALAAGIRALYEEAKALREEVKALRASSERTTENTQRSADTLSGRQGVPFLVQVAP